MMETLKDLATCMALLSVALCLPIALIWTITGRSGERELNRRYVEAIEDHNELMGQKIEDDEDDEDDEDGDEWKDSYPND